MATKRLDLVIFGATGFTGKYTVKEAARLAVENNFTWGVAGRRKDALEQVLKDFAPSSKNVKVIIANLNDEASLKQMTEQATVLVNCCGPYRFYGEPVIKACLETCTHHVDVSGEPQYMETMQLKYHKAAQEAKIYLVSACGFDSIPCDMGILYTQDQFGGEVNWVETYLSTWSTKKASGAGIHYGTWESAVYGLAHSNELRGIRSKLFPQRLPELQPKLKARSPLASNPISQGWITPFPGSDRSVCLRTQRFLYETYKQRPVQVQTYVVFQSLLHVLFTAFFGGIFLLFSKFETGRNLLLNYPRLFSAGIFSHEGPKEETMENSHFSITFHAKGWAEKLSEPTDEHKEPLNKEMITKVTAKNPGYGATCTALMFSAIMILKESDKMPGNGGVYPPGAAFGKTSMVEKLGSNGFKFEVISSIEK